MKIAILHYHLRRGGVTRIVQHAWAALESLGVQLAVICGEEPTSREGFPPIAVVPELNYNDGCPPREPKELANKIRDAAEALLGGAPDLYHVHNHSLGKNVFVPEALKILATRETPLLLQIHDFAEDRRPANYAAQRAVLPGDDLAAKLYPQAPHIHYAALTSRDLGHLASLGMPDARRHLLANPVVGQAFPARADQAADETPYILYPTRAIRRKNLGELLLLAVLDAGKHRWATTLRPENPQWQAIHAAWENLAQELELPIDFAVGEDPNADFEALVGQARAIVTTSVAEGFGLAFLEPALWGKPLIGRNLPDITADFADVGWQADGLYAEIPIPLAWLDEIALRTAYNQVLEDAFSAYERPLSEADRDAAWQALTAGGAVDFGRLPEAMQAEVIRLVHGDAVKRAALPSVEGLLTAAGGLDRESQAHVVETHFNPIAYGRRLADLYAEIASAPRGSLESGNAAALLDAFLDVKRANALLA